MFHRLTGSTTDGTLASGRDETSNNRYYQNYFRVADADLDLQDSNARDYGNAPGVYTCDGGTLSTEIVTAAVAEVVADPEAETPVVGVAAKNAVYPAPAQILARDGDKLTITAGTWVQELIVDGTSPEFASIAPENKKIQDSGTLRIAFTVRDDGSGLRHDGEFVDMPRGEQAGQVGDPERSNMDKDQVYEGEPLSNANGGSVDIGVLIADSLSDISDYHVADGEDKVYAEPQSHANDGDDQSSHGNGDWDVIEEGVAYRLGLNYNAGGSSSWNWQLVAVDRVGNASYSDADVNKPASQPYTLTIDNVPPIMAGARTGVTYNSKDHKEVKDRSFIALTFHNDNRGGSSDALDSELIDAARFLLEAEADAEPISVVDVLHSTDKKAGKVKPLDLDGLDLLKPASRVYLELSRELGADETPKVQTLSGAVSDLAGNSSSPAEITPEDKIEPGFAVTITADVTGRPAIGDDGEFEVSITSDEELLRSPTIYVASIDSDGIKTAGTLIKIKNVESSTVASDGPNAWSRTLDDGDLPNNGVDGLYAVIVAGEDAARNAGATAGWSGSDDPSSGHALDLVKLDSAALLIEKDTKLAKAVPEFTPRLGDKDPIETESHNPFVKLSFKAEGSEVKIDKETSAKVTKTKVDAKGTTVKFDSHASVTLGAVTLNGEAVDASQLRTLGSNEFLVQLNGLDIAKHELKYTAMDELGNSVSGTVKFEVKPRPAYKVTLRPGWNLISLPGTPADPAIGSVISDNLSVKLVLGYQGGAWQTAIREGASWSGTLTTIGGGWGYWVQSTAFETISALIPDVDTASELPTIPVTQGWNLLGVIDIQQESAGKAPIGKAEADDYFTSIPWRVAYSFDTRTTSWTKLAPETGVVKADLPGAPAGTAAVADEVLNGKGYWVWSSSVGVLVP